MGLTRRQELRHVFVPLSMPSMLAGVRTAAVICIGTATLAAFIGAGGLGDPIVTGLSLNDTGLIMQGAVPAALLAVATELGFEGVERALVPKHLRMSEPLTHGADVALQGNRPGLGRLGFAVGACLSPPPVQDVSARVEGLWSAQADSLACLTVRSAFDLYLRAQRWEAGSEIVFSALTVPDMPRIARHHGLCPVPLDIDPATAAWDDSALERCVALARGQWCSPISLAGVSI